MTGSVSSFGADWYKFGVLNVPSSAKNHVTSVASGANHGVALKGDGSIVTWFIKKSNLQNSPLTYDPAQKYLN
jgi:alpha-tubulin suppressor-like RCC1 family protein